MQPFGASPFDGAVDDLLCAIQENRELIDGALLSRVRGGLAAGLFRRGFQLSSADVEDVVSTAILHFVEAANNPGRVDPARSPAAYLMSISVNAAYDLLRRRQRHREDDLAGIQIAIEDEGLLSVLLAETYREEIRQALKLAVEHGDDVVVRVIGTWIDLSSLLDRSPTTREVASSALVSHTTVRRALKRFQGFLGPLVPE